MTIKQIINDVKVIGIREFINSLLGTVSVIGLFIFFINSLFEFFLGGI